MIWNTVCWSGTKIGRGLTTFPKMDWTSPYPPPPTSCGVKVPIGLLIFKIIPQLWFRLHLPIIFSSQMQLFKFPFALALSFIQILNFETTLIIQIPIIRCTDCLWVLEMFVSVSQFCFTLHWLLLPAGHFVVFCSILVLLFSKDMHIECSIQFIWNLYFYVSGQSGPVLGSTKTTLEFKYEI